jgi:hypothetical protein
MKMRNICNGCPCEEEFNGKQFCFWYQSYVNNTGCGNDFEEKPEKTQQELEDSFRNELNTFDMSIWRSAYEILSQVYRDLRNKNSVSPETKSIVSLFFEDYDGFIYTYEKEQRRKAGCSTYTDSKGKARYIKSNELF